MCAVTLDSLSVICNMLITAINLYCHKAYAVYTVNLYCHKAYAVYTVNMYCQQGKGKPTKVSCLKHMLYTVNHCIQLQGKPYISQQPVYRTFAKLYKNSQNYIV